MSGKTEVVTIITDSVLSRVGADVSLTYKLPDNDFPDEKFRIPVTNSARLNSDAFEHKISVSGLRLGNYVPQWLHELILLSEERGLSKQIYLSMGINDFTKATKRIVPHLIDERFVQNEVKKTIGYLLDWVDYFRADFPMAEVVYLGTSKLRSNLARSTIEKERIDLTNRIRDTFITKIGYQQYEIKNFRFIDMFEQFQDETYVHDRHGHINTWALRKIADKLTEEILNRDCYHLL